MRIGDFIDKKLVRNIDVPLVFTALALIFIGFITIASSLWIFNGGNPARLKIQIVAFVIGLIAVFIVMLFDYNTFGDFEIPIYVISIILLISVFIFGSKINGALSWIDIGPVMFQPSEVVKIGFILAFAKHLERKKDKLEHIFDVLPSLLYLAIPLALIYKQPDVGTILVFIFVAFFMMYAAGLSYKLIIFAFGSLIAILPVIWIFFLQNYQKNRILTFINPELDPSGSGYNVIQSKIAIGSGMFFGKGFFKGTQNLLGFIPERQTDFIFSVLGEEAGFVGSVLVVLLFVFLMYRIIFIAKAAKNDYGMIVCTGIMAMFLFHVLENIGMTIQLMPVTGIPLPFISYGGSSLLTNMVALGLVINIGMRRQVIRF